MTELKYKVGDMVLAIFEVAEVDGDEDDSFPYKIAIPNDYLWVNEKIIHSLLEQPAKQTDGLQLTLGDLELLCRASSDANVKEELKSRYFEVYNKIMDYRDVLQNAVLEQKITVGV